MCPTPATSRDEPGMPGRTEPVGDPAARLLSIDVFRGATLVFMVLVNNPGDPRHTYAPFTHARWHGWTATDLIFPFFLFIVGVAIPFSLGGRLATTGRIGNVHLQVLRRALVLFGLGLVLNGFPHYDLSTIRIMGVLQRIALCYLLGSILFTRLKMRGLAITVGILLMGYYVLMVFVPIPGGRSGVLEKVGNWGQFIDSHLMPGHLFRGNWESKSLLGTVPALANTLIGVLVGICLRSELTRLEKTVRFYFWGSVGILLGQFWGQFFPINQALWTSSLVLLSCGIGMVVFGSCYWLVDIRGIRWWTPPFVIFGVNSIFVWVGSTLLMSTLALIKLPGTSGAEVTLRSWLEGKLFISWAAPVHASELFALTYTLFWAAILAVLYWRRIFIKI